MIYIKLESFLMFVVKFCLGKKRVFVRGLLVFRRVVGGSGGGDGDGRRGGYVLKSKVYFRDSEKLKLY